MKIIVDGYCLGNPGQAGYKGIDADTHEILFQEDIGIATNNIAEYLAICHAFHYAQKNKFDIYVISDSLTAISWVRKNRTNSSHKGDIISRVEKAQEYVRTIAKNEYVLEKWDTKKNGENPADFGNK